MKRAFVLGVCPLLMLVACGLEAGESLPDESLGAAEQRIILTTYPPILTPVDAGTADAGTAPVDAGTADAGTGTGGVVSVIVPPMPRVATTPTPVSSWPATLPFIPSTAESAYVFVYRHPTDRTQFVAYGFDVRDARMLFFVSGDQATELSSFTSSIHAQLLNLPTLSGNSGAGTGVVYQVDVPIPPRPTPGINNADLLRAHFVWEMSALTHKYQSEAQELAQKNGW